MTQRKSGNSNNNGSSRRSAGTNRNGIRSAGGQRASADASGNSGRRQRTPEEIARIRKRRALERERQRKKKLLAVIAAFIVVVIVVLVIVIASNGSKNNGNENAALNNAEVTETTPETETTTEKFHAEVDLIAVGDVLMHTPLLNYASNGDGTYDFNYIFANTTDLISEADIAICNQETPIDPTVPADGGASFIFNTPSEIADAEINAGFDVVLQASNHSYDMGADGILHTAQYWDTRADEAMMIGMNQSQEERDTIPIYEKNGITFAMLNYTYGLNGFEMPEDMQYLVTLLTEENHDLIMSDIQKAKEMADFVIVFPHWGVEDLVGSTTEEQDYWAEEFTKAGADLIIGTHPHVCERIDWVEADGNRALCYYSLGNFASNQQEIPEILCGMARVKIVKDGDETYIDEDGTGVTPVVTHNVNVGDFTNQVTVYRLSDYNNDLAFQTDIYYNYDSSMSKETLDALADEIFGDWII